MTPVDVVNSQPSKLPRSATAARASYPTAERLANASPVELLAWFFRLDAPRNAQEEAILRELARLIDLPMD